VQIPRLAALARDDTSRSSRAKSRDLHLLRFGRMTALQTRVIRQIAVQIRVRVVAERPANSAQSVSEVNI
jgi:hypothetical protein